MSIVIKASGQQLNFFRAVAVIVGAFENQHFFLGRLIARGTKINIQLDGAREVQQPPVIMRIVQEGMNRILVGRTSRIIHDALVESPMTFTEQNQEP